LSTRTFTIFVVMALVTTFLTTPLTTVLYPPWYQVKVARWRRGEIDWDGNSIQREGCTDSLTRFEDQLRMVPVRKLLVYLRLDGLSGICTLAALLSSSGRASPAYPLTHPSKVPKQTEQTVEDAIKPVDNEETTLRVHGVRLVELTDRDSSVMKVSAGEQALWDPVVNTFRALGEWKDVSLMAGVSVVPEHSYADTVIALALQDMADLLLVPWSETGTLIDRQNGLEVNAAGRFTNGAYTDFVANILERVPGHVGILIENSLNSLNTRRPTIARLASGLSIQGSSWSRPSFGHHSHHVVLPFLGGKDDRFALRFVLQLAQNEQVTATIIQIGGLAKDATKSASGSKSGKVATDGQSDLVFFETLRDSVPQELQERVVFKQLGAENTISDETSLALTTVRKELEQLSNQSGSIVVVGRRSSIVRSDLAISIDENIGSDTSRVLGPIASAMVQPENKTFGCVLVLQSGMDTASTGDRH
jgi:hypothetical protein